jgi:hypothetical protein
MKHYKEVDGFKLYDEIYILDHHTIIRTNIIDIFDDYFSDESDYICKFVKTGHGTHRLEEISDSERIAEYRVQNKKDSYDRYVTRGY